MLEEHCLVSALAGRLACVYAALESPPLVPPLCCQADHTFLASGLHTSPRLAKPHQGIVQRYTLQAC